MSWGGRQPPPEPAISLTTSPLWSFSGPTKKPRFASVKPSSYAKVTRARAEHHFVGRHSNSVLSCFHGAEPELRRSLTKRAHKLRRGGSLSECVGSDLIASLATW